MKNTWNSANTLNKVTLIGWIESDVKVTTLREGRIATFCLVTWEKRRDKITGATIQEREPHNIVTSDGLAEMVAKYLKQGKKVYIEGRNKTRTFLTDDGRKSSTKEINAYHLIMLDPKESSEQVENHNHDKGLEQMQVGVEVNGNTL